MFQRSRRRATVAEKSKCHMLIQEKVKNVMEFSKDEQTAQR